MKNAIREYIELTDKEKQNLWKKAVFIFDTNIFLKLYQITEDARNIFFKSLEKIKDRIWMTYQTAYEFMKNRNKKILDINKTYESLNKEIQEFIDRVADVFNISCNDEDCCKHKQALEKWIKEHKEKNPLVQDFSNDVILNKIIDLFTDKTGKEYDNNILKSIKEEGSIRYKKKIPPGYKDINKSTEEEIDNNKYGDLIFWKQVIEYSKDNKKDIILVTNDKKEDWWEIINGKTIGPRPELKKEFMQETGKILHMYTLDSFLKYSENKIDSKILEEVKDDIDDKNLWETNNKNFINGEQYYYDSQIRERRSRLRVLNRQLDHLYSEYKELQEQAFVTKRYFYQVAAESKKSEIEKLERLILILREEIRNLMIEETKAYQREKLKDHF